MNEIVNNFLLVADKFMPEMHLKQPGFIYSTCGPLAKDKQRIEKLSLIRLLFSMIWLIANQKI